MAIAEQGRTRPAAIAAADDETSFSINIRIYVYPQGDRWYAASTDYVLMAEGATPVEAVERFVGSTMAYLTSALAHGWIDALNRRPPFLRRMEIRRRVFVARMLGRKPFQERRHLRVPGAQLTLA